jgi:hypothetical protein
MSNDNIATFHAPATNRVAAMKVLRANGWTLSQGWPLVTTMADLAAQSPGIFDGEGMGAAMILDTSGVGAAVATREIVEALKSPRKGG